MRAGMPHNEGSPLEIAVNRFDIVLPPPPLPCIGEDCLYAQRPEGCLPERHHLEFEQPDFAAHGAIAVDFQDLRALTVWMQECRHDELHDKNKITLDPPTVDVMEQAIYEDDILKQIGKNASDAMAIKRALGQPKSGDETRTGLDEAYKKHLERHQQLLEQVDEIEVIPAQLVTGFLLLAAPTLARRRIYEGTGFALTASSKIFKPEIYEPVDDFVLGGIMHEGEEIALRPKSSPATGKSDTKPRSARAKTFVPVPIPAI